MAPKRKRDILDFDPNKSDSEDENFEPEVDRPRSSRKKSRPVKPSRSVGRPRKNKYRGSDIEDDEVSESGHEDSFGEDDGHEDDDEDGDDEEPVNERTGRRVRKAAVKKPNYQESSGESEVGETDGKDELVGETPKKSTPRQSRIVVLNVPQSMRKKSRDAQPPAPAPVPTRRSTRARTAEVDADDELIELSNSGRHAKPARGSKDVSPEAAMRNSRTTRSGKIPTKAPVPTIEEATQESSSQQVDADGDDELMEDAAEEKVEQPDEDDQAVQTDIAPTSGDNPRETVEANEADDDDEDVPVTRRTRATRNAPADTAEGSAEPETAETGTSTGRRLTRRAKKSLQEPSSDFEPGNESGEDNESGSDKAKGEQEEDAASSSSNRRGRRGAKGKERSAKRSRQPDDSGDEVELDQEELAEELHDLRESDRSRRRTRRRSTPIEYEVVRERRRGQRVDYAIKPLDQLINEPEEEEAAPTPARRRGRAGAGSAWVHNLHTIAGPFGGVESAGPGALFAGPWGNGAAPVGDADSSDDETAARPSAVGNAGMMPASAAPFGALGAAKPHGLDGPGAPGTAAPNVGKVKDQKAYADADPLGVDMNVDFSKVGGLEGHIDQLKEMVQLPLLYPELFLKFHVTPPRGVLFHGPPGTGKTLLARALANSVGIGGKKITFYMRKGADALSKWVGEAEKQLRLLFDEARRTQPSIIFFDEIDGLAPVRSSKQEQIHASIVSTLLALMDGMDGRGQVIVIGATNRPDSVDPALRRPGRFDREFYFPLPDVAGRRAILEIHTKDWGLPDEFKDALARDTKGYGGADMRALCTEASLNAIQRTYPQIYSSEDKLIVNPDKITVRMADFSLSKKKIVPSSERSSASGAKPLPKAIEPLLRDQFNTVKATLDDVLPRQKKTTALEEAMFESYEDDDFGFNREALSEEFERTRVFRPRLLICGSPGMGHNYLNAAVLHYLEGVHIQNFDLPTIFGDHESVEQVIVRLFVEVKRHKPSVICIPSVDTWYSTMEGAPLTAFLAMLRSVPPTEPILVLGTAECEFKQLDPGLKKDIFGFSRKNCLEVSRPAQGNRRQYFSMIISHLRRFPKEFPDPATRKKRVLEKLPVAPPPPPHVPTKEEQNAEWLKHRHFLNLMKVHLQPIMDQINRKYRKFRTPVIPHSQIAYLFEEREPHHVRPDVEGAIPRPFVIAKDKDGTPGLRSTETGKFFYNLDIGTIEERLANGYYYKPQMFLRDVLSLEKDAKASGDRERILKASELVTNVEVDVNDVATRLSYIPWDELYQKRKQKMDADREKALKEQATLPAVNSDVAHENANGEGLHTTSAHFQVMSPLSNGHEEAATTRHATSNGTSFPSMSAPDDVPMTDTNSQAGSNTSPMQPPSQWPRIEPRPLNLSTRASAGDTTQGVSPSALANDGSTTKTSDPSNRSSNWSTQMTNGGHYEPHSSPLEHMPDTQPVFPTASQGTSSDELWPHSQAHGMARDMIQAPGYSQESRLQASPAKSSQAASMASILNEDELQSQSQQASGSSTASLQVELNETSADFFLEQLTKRTSGCTVEQLEQVTRELMAEIWRTRGEHNRMKVLQSVMQVFNEVIEDIEQTQKVQQSSQ